MGELLGNIVKRIPEVTYDLISRILPGGIVVAVLVSSSRIDGAGIPTPDSNMGMVIFLALAYAVGLAISALAHVCHFIGWPGIWLMLKGLRASKSAQAVIPDLKKLSWWTPLCAMNALGLAHEQIKTSVEKEREVVTKLFAEVALLYSLATALLVSLIITVTWNLFPINVRFFVSASVFFFVAGVIRSIRTWHRHAHILEAACKKA